MLFFQVPQAVEGTFSISMHRLPPEAGEGADVSARQVMYVILVGFAEPHTYLQCTDGQVKGSLPLFPDNCIATSSGEHST